MNVNLVNTVSYGMISVISSVKTWAKNALKNKKRVKSCILSEMKSL